MVWWALHDLRRYLIVPKGLGIGLNSKQYAQELEVVKGLGRLIDCILIRDACVCDGACWEYRPIRMHWKLVSWKTSRVVVFYHIFDGGGVLTHHHHMFQHISLLWLSQLFNINVSHCAHMCGPMCALNDAGGSALSGGTCTRRATRCSQRHYHQLA